MNIFLWILQILLAMHTGTGAAWKLSHSEQSVDSLKALPHAVWLALIAVELLFAVALVLPAFQRRLGKLAPIAAAGVAAEMLLFCAVHLASGFPLNGEIVYWLVVAALSAFIAYGRLALKPFRDDDPGTLART